MNPNDFPWGTDEKDDKHVLDANGITACYCQSNADAHFIVTAINTYDAHRALVEAARLYWPACEGCGFMPSESANCTWDCPDCRPVRKALAAVEAAEKGGAA